MLRYITAIVMLLTSTANAHEFWLQPEDYMITQDQEIRVNIRVGQMFKGNTFAFIPKNFQSYDITDNTGKRPVNSILGDTPSIHEKPVTDGLHVISHMSSSYLLTYTEEDKFTEFVTSKGLDWVLEAHKARGLPEVGFSEAYTRFAKSLIAVGDGAGQDAQVGMFYELVALANPYTDDVSGGLPVQLFWMGEPLADIQVDVFRRPAPDAEVDKYHTRTDAEGKALIDLKDGGEFLLDAVQMIEPFAEDSERTGAVWHSLWASMTFEYLP